MAKSTDKIESTLAYIRTKTVDTFISAYGLHSIFFHLDVEHLNNYGRPVTFEKYYVTGNCIIGKHLSTLVEEQNLDFVFNRDIMSISDLKQIDSTLETYNNFKDFNSYVKSFKPLEPILNSDKPFTVVDLKNMIYLPHDEEAIEELRFMLKHSTHRYEFDFEIPEEFK